MFERIIGRIPLVQTIYSAAKKLVDVLAAKAGQNDPARRLLIDWPHQGMKTVAFVMRSFHDAKTGAELAALYVPSALNPTSGFLQIVPVADLVFLDISTDQAMTMIISGGAIVPEAVVARSAERRVKAGFALSFLLGFVSLDRRRTRCFAHPRSGLAAFR